MRRLHRWISIIAAVYLLHVSITGMLLAWFNISSRLRSDSATPTTTPDIYIPALMTEMYARARHASGNAPIVSVRMRMAAGGHPVALVIFGGIHSGRLALDAVNPPYVVSVSGAVASGGVPWDSHTLLKRLHRGDFIGRFAGRYMSITAGLCLAFLVISGMVMYWQMWLKRRRAGRADLFWK
jgi:uncharacterized iron-regulated membrane protein